MTEQTDYTQAPTPRIIQWLLDTRKLWPVPRKSSSREEVLELKIVASRALSLLPDSEQASVLRYYQVKDARMSLASHLLKRLVVAKHCNVPWSSCTISREANGKPCYVRDESREDQWHFQFNVSHQAGVVTLIAVIGCKEKVDVGTDVVCVNERQSHDIAAIEKDGFFDWVDIHGDVFAESELNHMKLSPVPLFLGLPSSTFLGHYENDILSRCQWRNRELDIVSPEAYAAKQRSVQIKSNVVIDAKIRRFYAMWCLREAYVKMTGEALLAPWLKELEISDVQAPPAPENSSTSASLDEGAVLEDFKIYFKGNLVTNVKMKLTSLGSDYMVAGCVRASTADNKSKLAMGCWEQLNLETDILTVAESTS